MRGADESAQLAALLVRKALAAEVFDTSFLEGSEALDSSRTRALLTAHRIRWQLLRLSPLVRCALVAVTLLEKPLWCSAEGATRCGGGSQPEASCCHEPSYFTFGWDVLSCSGAAAVDAVVVAILACDLALWCVVHGKGFHWAHSWQAAQAIALVAALLDLLATASRLPQCGWRLMPYLRLFFLVSGDQELRREVMSCLHLMPEFLKVLLLLVTFVLLSAWFGAVLFTISGPEGSYFTNFAVSLWSLMALLATNNFPDIMMKGYTTNRAYGIFFTVYLVLGVYLLLQMVIAVVYNSYIRQREADLKLQAERRQQLLGKAFGVLDISGRGWLESDDLDALLAALGEASGFSLDDEARRALVFAVLDADGSGRVNLDEFGHLVHVLCLRFEPLRRPWLETSMPGLWSRCGCDRLGAILAGRRFELTIDGILLASACVTFIHTWPILIGSKHKRLNEFTLDNVMDLVVTIVFLLELVMKIAVLGWHTYWESWKNRFDAVVTVAAVGALGYVLIPNGYNDYMLVKSVVLLRLLRLLRLLADVPAFATVLAALAAVGPGARRVLPLLLCTMMAFAVLGCDIFGGCITTDPGSPAARLLSGTAFGQNGYYALNFNDRPGGAMTLFACLVMNNWNIYVEGFATASGPGAYVFFTVWWVVGNLLGLNLVTSVVLDAFVDRWGAMHGEGGPTAEPSCPHGVSEVSFDAGVVTGTQTGLSGVWTARVESNSPHGAAALDLRRMLEPAT